MLHTEHPYLLLVEDNADDIELTLRSLRKHGFDDACVVVQDGAEALDYIFVRGRYAERDSKHLPRMILLDIRLPKLSGYEVLRELRQVEETRRLPVVVLTSSREERDIVMSYDLGANSFIQKPLEYSQFSETIRTISSYWLTLNRAPLL